MLSTYKKDDSPRIACYVKNDKDISDIYVHNEVDDMNIIMDRNNLGMYIDQQMFSPVASGISALNPMRQKMIKEAQQNVAEDTKRREEVETRNQADQLAYQAEKNLKDYGDKIDSATRAKVEEAVKKVKEALNSGSIDSIKSASENLNSVWHQAAGQMYQRTGSAQPQAETTTESSGPGADKGKAVDADFEVVK